MAIAGQMSAAAARRCSRSASAIVRRQVTGFHNLTIDGCAASRKTPILQSAASRDFDAAGHRWRIRYFPNGSWWSGGGYMSLFLELHEDGHGGGGNDDPVEFTFTVLDPAGNPVPKYSRCKEEFFFSGASASSRGFPNFARWRDLEESGCLVDDKFTVRCDIAVRKEWTEDADDDIGNAGPAAPAAAVVVPPSDLREHLSDLLWKKKQGTDVTIYVGGGGGGQTAAHDAHGWLLAARSPVFEAELLAAAKEKVPGGGVRRHVELQGVEPKVFKAMLHYMYTDALPPELMAAKDVAMVQGLLAAAHRYKLERLKLMCEEMLCERVDMDTVAGILAVAKQHGCQVLEATCMEFISRPGNLKAVMETEGFERIKASCPELLIELLMKRFA